MAKRKFNIVNEFYYDKYTKIEIEYKGEYFYGIAWYNYNDSYSRKAGATIAYYRACLDALWHQKYKHRIDIASYESALFAIKNAGLYNEEIFNYLNKLIKTKENKIIKINKEMRVIKRDLRNYCSYRNKFANKKKNKAK